jgi:putative endonuclease
MSTKVVVCEASHARWHLLRLPSRPRRNGTLYLGITNNLAVRIDQHRRGRGSEFVKKYGVHLLVHVEQFASPQDVIARAKQ